MTILAALLAVAAAPNAPCAEAWMASGFFGVRREIAARVLSVTHMRSWVPISLIQPYDVPHFADCDDARVNLVFETAPGNSDSQVVAGCFGDFDGDGRRDYALLLRNRLNGSVRAFLFLEEHESFRVIYLGPPSDPAGFDDASQVPPGSFLIAKPRSGTFTSVISKQKVPVAGDLVELGWKTWYLSKSGTPYCLWTQD